MMSTLMQLHPLLISLLVQVKLSALQVHLLPELTQVIIPCHSLAHQQQQLTLLPEYSQSEAHLL